MTLDSLMHIVDDAYPDGLVWDYYTDPIAKGDTLAQFIMTEVRDTFDVTRSDVDQLKEAIRVMDRATQEINCVIEALCLMSNKYRFVELKEEDNE